MKKYLPICCKPTQPEDSTLSTELLEDPGITVQLGSQSIYIEPETLTAWGVDRETLLAMIRAEERHPIFRWIYVEHLLEKVIIYALIKKRDVTGIVSDNEHIWLAGRGVDLRSPKGIAKARSITGFRQGLEFGLLRPIQVILYALLGYQLYESITLTSQKSLLSSSWNILIHGNAQSIRGALSLIVANPANAPYLWPLLVLPVIWGCIKAVLYGRRALFQSPHDFQKAVAALRQHPTPLTLTTKCCSFELISNRQRAWWNILRWIFPLHFIDRQINHQMEALLFNGNLTDAERVEAIDALCVFIDGNSGYSRIVGLSAVRLLAAGIAFKQFDLLDHELEETELLEDEEDDLVIMANKMSHRQELRLREKIQALQFIRRYNPGIKTAWQQNKVWGLIHNSYAHYLKWTLGDWKNRRTYAGYAIFKIGKFLLLINLGKNIYVAITEYLSCPLPYEAQESFSQIILQQGRTNYTQGCFNAILGAFNKIPGQPACTIVNLLPQTDFHLESDKLDLSNKELTGQQVADLLNGIRFFYPQLKITKLDLSGNQINTKEDFEILMPMLTELEALWLSNNGIEGDRLHPAVTLEGTIALGRKLRNLPNLQILDLSKNMIGHESSEGTEAIGESLRELVQLRTLDLSGNRIGRTSSAGTKTIGASLQYLTQLHTLNLSANLFSYSGTVGTQMIGESLQYLHQLRILNMSRYDLGYRGSAGTKALGKSLGNLTQLHTLDLSQNWIAFTDDAGIDAISISLFLLTELEILHLSGNHIQILSNSNSSVIFSILHLSKLEQLYIQQQQPFDSFQINRLQTYWQHRNTQTDIYMLRDINAVQQYTAQLPSNTTAIRLSGCFNDPDENLVTILMDGLLRFNTSLEEFDFSNNFLGLSNATAAAVLCKKLQHFPRLRILNLSGNGIGAKGTSGTEALGQSLLFLTQLNILDVSGNSNSIGLKGTSGVESIGENLQHLIHLLTLNLSGNKIGYTGTIGTEILGKNLRHLLHLFNLDLSANTIGYTGTMGTKAIGESLPSLSQLNILDLSENWIGAHGTIGHMAIADGIRHLEQLQQFYFQGNFISYTNANERFALVEDIPDLICHGKLESFNIGSGLRNYSWEDYQQLRDTGFIYYSKIKEACEANSCHGGPITLPTGISCEDRQAIPSDDVCYVFSETSAAATLQPFPFYLLLLSAVSEPYKAITSSDTFSDIEMPSLPTLIFPLMIACKTYHWLAQLKPKFSFSFFSVQKEKTSLGDLFITLANLKLLIQDQLTSTITKKERNDYELMLISISHYQEMGDFSARDIEEMQSCLENIKGKLQQIPTESPQTARKTFWLF